jgi:hypothetical protein
MVERDPLQMALDEAARHGASREDLSRLREYFRKRAEDKFETALSPEKNGAQPGDIPS